MVNKTHIFINNKFYLTKTEMRTNKISNAALILLFWVNVIFMSKNDDILQNNADVSKPKVVLVLHTCVYLRLKYQISSF